MTDPEGLPAQSGPQEGRCGAVRKRDDDGQPIRWCRKYPRRGQKRCEDCGGSSPQALAAAERRLQEQEAHTYVAKYGMPQHVEWHEAIQGGLNETYGNVLAMRDLVLQLRPEALTWGQQNEVTIGSSQFPGIDITHAAGIAPVVQLYGQERDRLHRMAVDAGKLGLEARRDALAERNAVDFLEFMRGTLTELDGLLQAGEISTVNPSDPTVLAVVSGGLRALAGTEAVA